MIGADGWAAAALAVAAARRRLQRRRRRVRRRPTPSTSGGADARQPRARSGRRPVRRLRRRAVPPDHVGRRRQRAGDAQRDVAGHPVHRAGAEDLHGRGDGSPCCEWWAPEVHQIDGRWYVYVAADDGDNENHRTYVLSADTITGPYAFEGRLELPGDRWAIDATVFAVGDATYMVWSGWPGDEERRAGPLPGPARHADHGQREGRPRSRGPSWTGRPTPATSGCWSTRGPRRWCATGRSSSPTRARAAGPREYAHRAADRGRVGRPARPGVLDEVARAGLRAGGGQRPLRHRAQQLLHLARRAADLDRLPRGDRPGGELWCRPRGLRAADHLRRRRHAAARQPLGGRRPPALGRPGS